MSLRNWIIEHYEFNKEIKTEEDLKVKVLIPYLEELGYSKTEMRFEHGIEVVIGSKKTTVFSDIEILIDGKVELVIDTKSPSTSLKDSEILQSASYSKLISTPPALYSTTTNGIDCVTTNIFTGIRDTDIPTKSQLLRDIDKTKKRNFSEVEIREIKSVLLTLLERDELFKVIKKCKEIIEKKGLIRSDQSFKEMTKILLVKMNEERRVKVDEGTNRFLVQYLDKNAKANDETVIDVFKRLFDQALTKYTDIYTKGDENLLITDNDCLRTVVEYLEPFSFLGTGEDIKGAVYEIFLKSTLRGDFDQYFTPREIVDFMVKFSDLKIGQKFVDPTCGSGGFLIQGFNYVNNKIINSPFSEVESKKKFSDLIDKSIWGQEADYDLHVLAKINLIMHGDGWNNIYQGDTLMTDYLKNDSFDIVLTNPPFTIKYAFESVLSHYEMGIGKPSEELDILFVEKSLNLLKEGGDMYIILPEGLMNNRGYDYFRKWMLEKAHLICSISLPEGAFIPFGGSVSKTCIVGLRKKSADKDTSPKYVFVGKAAEIGYDLGKKQYKTIGMNDLPDFLNASKKIFTGILATNNGGECGWLMQKDLPHNRLDGGYLLNKIDQEMIKDSFENCVPLRDIVYIDNISVSINSAKTYKYLEVPDISPETGLISNIRTMKGVLITSNSLRKFEPGDILFTRINPRKGRVSIAPPFIGEGVMSNEIFRLRIREDNPFISIDQKYAIPMLLKSRQVLSQVVRLSTGSSSSRARVQEDDFLDEVYVPIPNQETLNVISKGYEKSVITYWELSQQVIEEYANAQNSLGDKISRDYIRGI